MQKSVIFANGAIKHFDPQLFGLKSLTGKLILILHPAFCQVPFPKASEPQRSQSPRDLDLCVLRSVRWDLSHLVLAVRHRVFHLSWPYSSPCNQQRCCEDGRLVCLSVGQGTRQEC